MLFAMLRKLKALKNTLHLASSFLTFFKKQPTIRGNQWQFFCGAAKAAEFIKIC